MQHISLLFTCLCPLFAFAQIWQPVGPVDTPELYRVHDIIKYNDELIIGGEFDSVHIGIDRVAVLRNGYWEERGSGLKVWGGTWNWENGVHLLAEQHGKLIAGGYFFNLCSLSHLVRWDDQDWEPFSDSYTGKFGVNCSAWYRGKQYLGGEAGFARWDFPQKMRAVWHAGRMARSIPQRTT